MKAIYAKEEEEMPETTTEPSMKFFDVFISYRHGDAGRIKELKKKIRSFGYSAFQDTDFPEFRDTKHVPAKNVKALRYILSQATCLIFAYSRENPETEAEADWSVGAWMPWELGFFDGSISDRIGIYLLDGPPKDLNLGKHFRHSEYLQVYELLTDENLKAFLDRNAVRERRVDNVRSAFVWFEHLREERLTNPTNVSLGIAEWFADHAANYWKERGNEFLAETFGWFKVLLDNLRVTMVPFFRWPLADAWFSNIDNQWREAALRTLAESAMSRVDKPTTPARPPASPLAVRGALLPDRLLSPTTGF
jgi:hypothetical protein